MSRSHAGWRLGKRPLFRRARDVVHRVALGRALNVAVCDLKDPEGKGFTAGGRLAVEKRRIEMRPKVPGREKCRLGKQMASGSKAHLLKRSLALAEGRRAVREAVCSRKSFGAAEGHFA